MQHSGANVEVKCFDLSANPYLLLGCLVAAGLAGVRDGLELPPEVTGDPARLDATEATQRGIVRLPHRLEQAVQAFAAEPVLRAALGDTLADAVIAVRTAEAERLRDATDDEIAAALRWVH
jgi:glutamine synthetase